MTTLAQSLAVFEAAKPGDVLEVNHFSFREQPGVARVVERTPLGLRMTNGSARIFVEGADCIRLVGQSTAK